MPWTDPKTWTIGELVTAANLNIHLRDNLLASFPHLLARKTSDQTLSSQTTLQNITDLSFSIGANETWQVFLVFTASDASGGTADVKWGVTGPAGATVFIAFGMGLASADISGTFVTSRWEGTVPQSVVVFASGNRNAYNASGQIVTSGTAGTIQFQYAQNVSNAALLTCYANSVVWGMKLA